LSYNCAVLPAVQTEFFTTRDMSCVCRFHGDQCYHHTNIQSPNQFKFCRLFLALPVSRVRHFFRTTCSVFERVVLPAVQGKFISNLYVTGCTEACTACRLYDGFVRPWKCTLRNVVGHILLRDSRCRNLYSLPRFKSRNKFII
jgi:hypothetical protein